MNKKFLYKTWIEVSKKAVANNIRAFRSILKKNTKLFAVVKSNAYGHGLVVFSELANNPAAGGGVDGFCVDAVVEGKKLRNAGIKKPILVLGPTLPHLYKEAAAYDITVTISNFDALKDLIHSRTQTKFHIKIDTGMHRQGFYVSELSAVLKQIQNSMPTGRQAKFKIQNFLAGAYTHFAAAKDILYPDYTTMQCGKFIEAKNIFLKNGFKNLIFHAAATGGTVSYPKSHFDMVRIGLGLYGYFPTPELKTQHPLILKKKIQLKPILSWRALVSEVKNLKKGDRIGYDLTEEAQKDTKTAIVPIGYWHGFPRSLSNHGEVLIKGTRAKVLGRVSMDLIIVEVSKQNTVKVGDKVTFIGKDGKEIITAEEIARNAGTIQYEFLTRLNPLIKRIVV